MASAAEHSHYTDLSNAQLLPEGVEITEHLEIVDIWEVDDPTPVPPDEKIRTSKRGKLSSLFYTVVYEDAPSDSAGGVQYCRQAVESDVRNTSRKVFRLEAPETH